MELTYTIYSGDDTDDVGAQMARATLAEGRLRYHVHSDVSPVKAGAILGLPEEGVITMMSSMSADPVLVIEDEPPVHRGLLIQEAGDESWRLIAVSYGTMFKYHVVASTNELAHQILRQVMKGKRGEPPVHVPDPTIINVTFTWYDMSGPSDIRRQIRIKQWADIRQNYAAAAQGTLDQLMALTPEAVNGKIILLHGVPGTGKTYLLRALGAAWRNWCDVTYVIDPEAFLNQGTYLLKTMFSASHERWRLIIMEDSGEMFSADARERSGQGLSRLLNVADGILGQGLPILFAMTTNERIEHLHAAVTRPGRGLLNLEIPAFQPDQASEWLGTTVTEPMTLAEMYAMSATPMQAIAEFVPPLH